MRVAISGYVGKKITGIGRNLKELLSHSANNEYVVFVNEDMKEDFDDLPDNVTLVPYPVSKNSSLGNLLWTTFVFPFKAKRAKADLALIPNFTLLIYKLLPTAVVMHDLIEFNVPDKFSKLKMFYRTKLADPITAKSAARIMTVSECSKKDLNKFLSVPEEKIDVVYNGVDEGKFSKQSVDSCKKVLQQFGIEQPFLLYAGTVDHPGKNVYTLIKAFELLCDEGYEGELVIAGMPGSGYEVVDQEIQASPHVDRIRNLGYVSDEELRVLYSTCDVFCFLSLYEGFGLPPLEAMACGAKVLVSDQSSLPEVVGDCGETVAPLDVEAVKQKITLLLEGERDPQMISDHLKRFRWSDLSLQFEDFLQKAVKK